MPQVWRLFKTFCAKPFEIFKERYFFEKNWVQSQCLNIVFVIFLEWQVSKRTACYLFSDTIENRIDNSSVLCQKREVSAFVAKLIRISFSWPKMGRKLRVNRSVNFETFFFLSANPIFLRVYSLLTSLLSKKNLFYGFL